MTKSEIQIKINVIREELEARHKYGTIKMAAADGTPVSTELLQNEMFRLIYKISKLD